MLFFLISASVFSIDGLGQERAVFNNPFYGSLATAQIEFTLQPEFNILNQKKDFRSLFWTNPFYLNIKIPVYRDLTFSFGNSERFNQSFDIYSEKPALKMYVRGRGGIEEVYLQLNQNINFVEVFLKGSYLFGKSEEIWRYTIGDYTIADTFYYLFTGRVLGAGLKLFILSCHYEGLGSVNLKRSGSDTIYSLPQVFSLGLENKFSNWRLSLRCEYAIWRQKGNIIRFKGIATKENWGLSYAYNPWYLDGIKEHCVDILLKKPLRAIGYFSFRLNSALRIKRDLREFVIVPELKLGLEEIFARRKR